MTDAPHYLPIHALHKRYRDGGLSPLDVMSAHLSRVLAFDGGLNAYIRDYGDEALGQAEAAALAFKHGASPGPLTGVGIALKDLIDVRGRVTTGGSPERSRRISPATATVAARLHAAGAICTGKTMTTEMAMGGWGTNEHMGTPWNPWDMTVHRVPGGSSAGSGVAVAAGFAAGAVGTDTGGSVRLPAAFCGLVGLKVTEGVLPTDGIIPLSATLDTPGPMTRSVIDAALMFEVMRGAPPDRVNADLEKGCGLFHDIERGVKGLRIGTIPEAWLRDYDGEVVAAFRRSADALANLGAEIVPFKPAVHFDAHKDAAMEIIAAEGYHANRAVLEKAGGKVDQFVRRRLEPGKTMTADAYLSVLAERERAKSAFRPVFEQMDAFLSPTTRAPAIPVNDVDEAATPAGTTRVANYLGLCGLAIPNGFTAGTGLPISLQIICAPRAEAMALRIGRAYEKAADWLDRHPD